MQRSWMWVAVPLCLAACDKDKDVVGSDDVQQRTDAIVSNVVVKTVNSFTNLGNRATFDALGSAFDKLGNAFPGMPAILPASEDDSMPPSTPGGMTCSPEVDGCEESTDPAEIAQEINDWLAEHVFSAANLEESDETTAVFRLHGADICGERCEVSECPPEDATCIPTENCALDEECVANIDAVEIRVRATLTGADAVRIELLIGPAQIAPISLDLSPTLVAAEVDLGEAKLAAAHVLSVVDPEGNVELPSVMSGRLRAELGIAGEDDVSVKLSVLEAVALAVTLPEGDVTLNVAASSPWFSMLMQGTAGVLSLDLDLGAVDVSAPYKLIADSETASGTLAAHLDGLSGAVDLAAGVDVLTLSNLGLGDETSAVTKDGVSVLAVDLNADAGRSFDLTVTPSDGSATFAVAPGFSLSILTNFQELLAEFPDIDSFLLDETYAMGLTGETGGSVRPVENELGEGGLRVESGTLSISSTAAAEPIVVETGACLLGQETTADGAHPILGHLYSGACP